MSFKQRTAGSLSGCAMGCSTAFASTILTGCAIPNNTFERLRASAPDAWILAEKILGPEESLAPDMADRGYHRLRLSERMQWAIGI
jgi:hypothetical protein